MAAIREILRENEISLLGYSRRDLSEEINWECEKAYEWLDTAEIPEDLGLDTTLPRDVFRAAFAKEMGRLVKASHLVADLKGVTPLTHQDEGFQKEVREQFFSDYVRLYRLLSLEEGEILSERAAMPVIYQHPATIERIFAENSDYPPGALRHLIYSSPTNPEQAVATIRELVPKVQKKYPLLPPSEVRRIVMSAPDSYESAIRRFAERAGYPLAPLPEKPIAPDEFVDTIRSLQRTKKIRPGKAGSTPEGSAASKTIRAEAADWYAQSFPAEDSDEARLFLEGFLGRVEALALLSDKAWRRALIGKSVSHFEPGGREEIYLRTLTDYSLFHALLSSNEGIMDQLAKKNPVLYHTPEYISDLRERYSHISLGYFTRLVLTNIFNPEEGIVRYEERVKELKERFPRFIDSMVRRLAIDAPDKDFGIPEQEPNPELTTAQVMAQVREAVNAGTNIGRNPPMETRIEATARELEAGDWYERLGWKVDGKTVPAIAREELMERLVIFVMGSEYAWQKGIVTGTVGQLEEGERYRFYETFAREYLELVDQLSASEKRDWEWKNIPVIYLSPDDLRALRERYQHIPDGRFIRMARSKHRNLKGTLDRYTETVQTLTRRYPTASIKLIAEAAVASPNGVEQKIHNNLFARVNQEAKWFDTKVDAPSPKRPDIQLRFIRTRLRKGEIPYIANRPHLADMDDMLERGRAWLKRTRHELTGKEITEFSEMVRRHILASNTLAMENDRVTPIYHMTHRSQTRYFALVLKDAAELSRLMAERTGRPEQLRILEFTKYHSTEYFSMLHRRFEGYLPDKIITYVALSRPQLPHPVLSRLVVSRGNFLNTNPQATEKEMNEHLLAALKTF